MAHAWSDIDYFGVVTEDAQICIFKVAHEVVLHTRYDLASALIGLEFHEHGCVTVSKNGFFIFFEKFVDDDDGEDEFQRLRTWGYDPDQTALAEGVDLI